jgi:hypothetical protein
MQSKPTKQATKLPDRSVLKGLMKSNMGANDYAKVTPVKGTEMAMSPLLEALRMEQAQRRS